MAERIVEIQIDAEEVERLIKDTQNGRGESGYEQALAYLSNWNPTFPGVRIMKDFGYGGNNLVAVFEKENGTTGYVIGAVWDSASRKYSFHS